MLYSFNLSNCNWIYMIFWLKFNKVWLSCIHQLEKNQAWEAAVETNLVVRSPTEQKSSTFLCPEEIGYYPKRKKWAGSIYMFVAVEIPSSIRGRTFPDFVTWCLPFPDLCIHLGHPHGRLEPFPTPNIVIQDEMLAFLIYVYSLSYPSNSCKDQATNYLWLSIVSTAWLKV